MLTAIILFAVTYVLMLTFSKFRPYIALASGVLFVVLGMLPLKEIIPFTMAAIIPAYILIWILFGV